MVHPISTSTLTPQPITGYLSPRAQPTTKKLYPQYQPTSHDQHAHQTTHNPRKKIITQKDLACFNQSTILPTFIQELTDSVENVTLRQNIAINNPKIEQIIEILQQIEMIMEETPRIEQEDARFGNKAFISFYDKVHNVRLMYLMSAWLTLKSSLSHPDSIGEHDPNLEPTESASISPKLSEHAR